MSDYLKEIQRDVDQMNKYFAGEPITDSPGTNVPASESPATEPSGTEAPGTESPNTTAPVTEVPLELDERDKTIEELRAKLAEKESKSSTRAPSTEAPLTFEDQDFIGELDLDDLSRDPVELNKLLNKIYQKAVSDTRKVISERDLRTIPSTIDDRFNRLTTMRDLSNKFYTENKDLEPFKKVVATVFEELSEQNPKKRYDEIMKDVAPEVRKRLELPTKPQLDKGTPPRLPRTKGKSGRSTEPPKLSPIESEIDEMNKVLGGNN